MNVKEKLDKPIDEIEVDDEMVLAAAKDINDRLEPNPLLDLEKPGEELQKDVEELFEGIIEGDKLSDDTWKILKALGWKSSNQEQATNKKEDQSVKEKTKTETNAGEVWMAAADVQKSLAVNPPLDLNVGEEVLKEELASLLPNIQEEDDLAVTTWATLKKLGWGKTKTLQSKKLEPKSEKTLKVAKAKKPSKILKGGSVFSSFSGKLKVTYKGQTLKATVKDGVITFQGKKYDSPSTAGLAARLSVQKFEGRVTCNGWAFWSYEQTPGKWAKLDAMRK